MYSCNSYTRYGTECCTSHSIEARDLHNAVIADINLYAEMALNDPKAVKTLQQRLSALDVNQAKAFEREKRKLSKRLTELDKLFSALYEDKVMERITERNFALMSEKYEREQLDADKRLQEIESELKEKGIADRSAVDFLSLIRPYHGITELTATTVNALIDKITVSEREKGADGTVRQRIKIYYKFVGNLHEAYIAVTERSTVIPSKVCSLCGITYQPNSNVAKNCPACRKKKRQENYKQQNKRRATLRSGNCLVPKPCECCGIVFMPQSHNANCCPAAKAKRIKECSKQRTVSYFCDSR